MTRFDASFPLSVAPVLLLLALSSCSTEAPTSPAIPIDAARAAPTTEPTVTATDPDTGFRSTTIDVRVIGSGFDNGSRAIWALKGDTAFATTRIKTNSTRYVKSTELMASITIAADAPLEQFDVVVLTAGGKKGIGIERFTVTYQIIDLGTLGGLNSRALAINDQGQVVGWSHTASGEMHAFLWTESGGMQDLGTLGGATSEARDINNAGEVVGVSASSTVWRRPFRWTAETGMQDLGPVTPNRADAFTINGSGDIAGWGFSDSDDFLAPFLWTEGGVQRIDTAYAWVNALNTMGQAAGAMQPDMSPVAVFWQRTASGWTRHYILPPDQWAGASDLNNLGQVAGSYTPLNGGSEAFVWSLQGGFESLPPLVAGRYSGASAINKAGQVAGYISDFSAGDLAVLWTRSSTGWEPKALPRLGNNSALATAMNERGDIAGYSWAGHGKTRGQHAVLWTLR